MTPSHVPFVVDVPSRWDAIFEPDARSSLERVLPEYVSARRWYRTKTKSVRAARVVAALPLLYGQDRASSRATSVARITLVELTLDDDTRETYVLPLAFVSGDAAARLEARCPHALVLPLRISSEAARTGGAMVTGHVVDALVLEEVAIALLRAIARGGVIEDAEHVLALHPLAPVREATRASPGAFVPRLAAGEQTNTSLFFGDRFVGKVLRKLDPGESPDLEMVRFLTAAGYTHTPALAGWVDVRARGASQASTVALLQVFAPNRGDAWSHAEGVLDRWLARVAERTSAPPVLVGDLLARASAPLSPEIASLIGDYGALAELLGRRVGEMHALLASRSDVATFRPEPLEPADRERILRAATSDLDRVITLLGARGGELPGRARDALADVRANRGTLSTRLSDALRAAEGGVRTRVHGDLHLGQVLFTGNDFVLIDFEGEPARSLEERRSKRSPFVDVAGMLRSFHYAVVAALRAKSEAERGALAPWTALWYRAVTAAFLRGWLHAVRGSVVLPSDAGVTRALLDLFLFEKCVYEIGYELDNRPDWVELPLEGLRDLMTDRADEASREGRPAAPLALDDDAIRSFLQGRATRAYALFGAHPGPEGTDFAVWAPNATRVEVLGDFDAWSGIALRAESGSAPGTSSPGIFAGRIAPARAGDRYKYRVWSASGPRDKSDPFGYAAEVAPPNASVIASLDEHLWRDEAWMDPAARHERARRDRPMSIYEVHLGSWRRVAEEGARWMTYREIASPLARYAREMGFTHVELMPVMEHPYYASWGYGVTGFFAPTSRYGSPADLMYLVDTLHRAGVGVIFDWVPAHFARDAHGLSHFDGSPTFEPADAARAVHPTWDTGMFDFSRPEVRSFLLSSATFWIERFHADGLRVDGVESILYRDHQRAPGTWTPNALGGREDLEGIAFLRALTSVLKEGHPEVLLIAEDSSSWPGVTRPVSEGGLGFDLKWDMGFSHDMRRYLARDPLQRSQHQDMLTFRSVYANNEAFVLPLSHDDVVEERGGALLQQMHGDAWQRLANLRLLYAMTYAQPGKKLLFMGDEWGQRRPWHHDRELDWLVRDERAHDGVARMVGDLNRLYSETPALYEGDAAPGGFDWIDGTNATMSVVTFLRKGRGDAVVVVAMNFTPVPRHSYRIGVPRAGLYREVFNSDATEYGGSGHGNLGGVEAVTHPWNGRPCSVVVTLPPLGALFLASE